MYVLSLQAGLRVLPLQREIRKDHPFPVMGTHRSYFQEAWEVYCDDTDFPKVVLCPEELEEPAKEDRASQSSELQESARGMFEYWNLPRSEKSGTGE